MMGICSSAAAPATNPIRFIAVSLVFNAVKLAPKTRDMHAILSIMTIFLETGSNRNKTIMTKVPDVF